LNNNLDNLITKTQNLFPKIDSKIVEKVIRSQFLFVKEAMEQGNYDTIMLAKLGKFACKEERIKKLKEKKLIKNIC
jgi:hypothetical protein